jgi:hypothetical protein
MNGAHVDLVAQTRHLSFSFMSPVIQPATKCGLFYLPTTGLNSTYPKMLGIRVLQTLEYLPRFYLLSISSPEAAPNPGMFQIRDVQHVPSSQCIKFLLDLHFQLQDGLFVVSIL